MQNTTAVPTTLEYADTLSLHHLHTLFDRRMALRKGTGSDMREGTSPGPSVASPALRATSPTQHTTSFSGLLYISMTIIKNPTIVLVA